MHYVQPTPSRALPSMHRSTGSPRACHRFGRWPAVVGWCPWYGLHSTVSASRHGCLHSGPCGHAASRITAGYHRLWAQPLQYGAHWSVRHVAECCSAPWRCRTASWSGRRSTARHHRFVDDWDKDPYSAEARVLVLAHGLDPADYPSGENDFSNARDLERDPIVMFQPRSTCRSRCFMKRSASAAGRAGWSGRRPGRVPSCRGAAALVVNHTSRGSSIRSRTCGARSRTRTKHGPGQPGGSRSSRTARVYHNYQPHLPERLPQRREVVPVDPTSG
jgi:hypothetical protein